MRGGMREPRVKDDQLRAIGFAIDDALRVRIEIMTRLEVSADQQNHFRVCMVRTWAIESHPELIAFAAGVRADVRMRVVPVNTPSGEDALGKTVFTGPADVIHDLVTTLLNDCFANATGNVIQRVIPTYSFPLAFTAFARALKRIKNAIRIGDLIQSRRSLGAIATARAWMLWITFKLLHLAGGFVDVGQQTASRFAVEAGGGYK